MWVRKRIEIRFFELIFALFGCLLPIRRRRAEALVADQFGGPETAFCCLSVRSGFDLLLNALDLPRGSEILITGLTIPDMPRIVSEHELIPVGLDFDLDTLAPDPDDIEQLIGPQTRAIVITHLLGGRCEMDAIIELAHRHNLVIIEDCAQAYVGNHYQGDSRADVSMFSFGPIKTNTALGGGILIVRKSKLMIRLKNLHSTWQTQSRWGFARRVCKYMLIWLISKRFMVNLIFAGFKIIGRNLDEMASQMAKGFRGPRFFDRIRKRPSVALLRLMAMKLRRFEPEEIHVRTELGHQLAKLIRPDVSLLGNGILKPTYWVFPILVDQPSKLIESLQNAGFDATQTSSMRILHKDAVPSGLGVLKQAVFLPLDTRMHRQDLCRMVMALRQSGVKPGPPF